MSRAAFEQWFLTLDPDFGKDELTTKQNGDYFYTTTQALYCQFNTMDEVDELLRQMGVTREWQLDNIKETAMNRHNVRKGQRQHIKNILDEAFALLREAKFVGKDDEDN